MSVTDCTHGMPTPAACVTCMEDGNMPPAPKPEPVIIVATFGARYEGECPSCGLAIAIGQPIHKLSSERYVHAGCE